MSSAYFAKSPAGIACTCRLSGTTSVCPYLAIASISTQDRYGRIAFSIVISLGSGTRRLNALATSKRVRGWLSPRRFAYLGTSSTANYRSSGASQTCAAAHTLSTKSCSNASRRAIRARSSGCCSRDFYNRSPNTPNPVMGSRNTG